MCYCVLLVTLNLILARDHESYCNIFRQELTMEMRYPNVTCRIILPVYLFTTELGHTCSSRIFF